MGVNRILGPQSNDGYGEDSGPSRRDPCTRANRPIEASKAAIRNGCFTSTPPVEQLGTNPGIGRTLAIPETAGRQVSRRMLP